jgi:hypothetical protein
MRTAATVNEALQGFAGKKRSASSRPDWGVDEIAAVTITAPA